MSDSESSNESDANYKDINQDLADFLKSIGEECDDEDIKPEPLHSSNSTVSAYITEDDCSNSSTETVENTDIRNETRVDFSMAKKEILENSFQQNANESEESQDPEREKLLAILEGDRDVEEKLRMLHADNEDEENNKTTSSSASDKDTLPSVAVSNLNIPILHPQVDTLIDLTDEHKVVTIKVEPADNVIVIDDDFCVKDVKVEAEVDWNKTKINSSDQSKISTSFSEKQNERKTGIKDMPPVIMEDGPPIKVKSIDIKEEPNSSKKNIVQSENHNNSLASSSRSIDFQSNSLALGVGGVHQHPLITSLVTDLQISKMAKNIDKLTKIVFKEAKKKSSRKKSKKKQKSRRSRRDSSSTSWSRSRSRSSSISRSSSRSQSSSRSPSPSRSRKRKRIKLPKQYSSKRNYRSSRTRSESLSPERKDHHSRDSKRDHSRDSKRDHSRVSKRDHSRVSKRDHSTASNRDDSRDSKRDNFRDSKPRRLSQSPILHYTKNLVVKKEFIRRSVSPPRRKREYSSSSESSSSSRYKRRRPSFSTYRSRRSKSRTPDISHAQHSSVRNLPSTSQQSFIQQQTYQEEVRQGNNIVTRQSVVTTSFQEELKSFEESVKNASEQKISNNKQNENELIKIEIAVFDEKGKDVTIKRPDGDLNHPFYIHPEDAELYQMKCRNGLQPLQALHEICIKCKWKLPTYMLLPTPKGFRFGMDLNGHRFVTEKTAPQKKLAKAAAAVGVLKWMRIVAIEADH